MSARNPAKQTAEGRHKDFNELISDFATRHQVEGLAAEDGSAAIEVDGIVVLLTSVGGELLASAEIGEPPPEGR